MIINIIGGKGVVGNGIYKALDHVHHVNRFGTSSFNIHTLKYDDDTIYHCDCLIHAAGVTDEEVKADPEKAMIRATVAVTDLIRKCQDNGCRYFVYISSVHVYGDIEGVINESSIPNPKTHYGICHLFTEAIFNKLSYESGISCLILRVPTIYGYPADLEKLNRPALIPYDFPRQLVTTQKIELKSSGLQNRNFCSNEKVGKIIKKWLNSEKQGCILSNVNGDYSINVRAFSQQCIRHYKELTGKEGQLFYKEENEEDHPLLSITAKLDEPEVLTLDTFIKEYISWLLNKEREGGAAAAIHNKQHFVYQPSPMHIVVTGATGFIGRHVIPMLLKNNHRVTAIVRNRNKPLEWQAKCTMVEHEIGANDDRLIEKIGRPDALLHLAWGHLPNYRSMHHIDVELPVNYVFVRRMIEAGVTNISVVGTCFEYGMQSGALSENLNTEPSNPYGYAKDALRKQLQLLQKQLPFKLNWLRLFYMYGEDQPDNTIYAKLKANVLEGKTIFNMSGGEQLRDYLHIDQVCTKMLTLIEQQQNFGIVNICNGTPISVRALVENWKKENNWDIELNLGHFPYPDYEPMAFWGDNTKYEELTRAIIQPLFSQHSN